MRDLTAKVFLLIKMNLKIIFIFGGISFLAISFFIMSSIKRTDKEENILFSSATSLKNDSNLSVSSSDNLSSKDEKVDFYVDVKGAVAQEKVVKVKSGEIIISAINKSGGAKSNADLSQINLAAEIISGQVIYVPKKVRKFQNNFVIPSATALQRIQTLLRLKLISIRPICLLYRQFMALGRKKLKR